MHMESVKHYITDMDGVLVKGMQVIPGADRFIARLQELGREYLVLTNNSLYAPRDLAHRLNTVGLEIPTDRLPYVGKANPLMMRSALNHLDVHSEDTVMVGDRMETDIVAGVESGMRTILVLSGVTRREDIDRFPYRPSWSLESVADIEL